METQPPNEPASGGTDLLNEIQVQILWDELVRLRAAGFHIVIHFALSATPGSTRQTSPVDEKG